jgi:hypothetical protein
MIVKWRVEITDERIKAALDVQLAAIRASFRRIVEMRNRES